MKKLLIIIVLAILITTLVSDFRVWDWHFHFGMGNQMAEMLMGLTVVAIVICVLMVTGFLLAFGLIGIVVAVVGSVFLSIFIVSATMFWPFVLVAVLAYYLGKDKRQWGHHS